MGDGVDSYSASAAGRERTSAGQGLDRFIGVGRAVFDPLPSSCGPTDDVHGPPASLCQAGKGLLEDADSARDRSVTDERQSAATRRAQNLAAQATRDMTNPTSTHSVKSCCQASGRIRSSSERTQKRFGKRWTSHGRWRRRGISCRSPNALNGFRCSFAFRPCRHPH